MWVLSQRRFSNLFGACSAQKRTVQPCSKVMDDCTAHNIARQDLPLVAKRPPSIESEFNTTELAQAT